MDPEPVLLVDRIRSEADEEARRMKLGARDYIDAKLARLEAALARIDEELLATIERLIPTIDQVRAGRPSSGPQRPPPEIGPDAISRQEAGRTRSRSAAS